MSRAVGALLLSILVACDYVASDPGGNAPSSTTLALVASPSPAPTPNVLDDRFGYVVSDGHGTSKVRSETSDVAITTFMPQGRSWTSLSNDVSPDGRSIAYWAPALNGAVLHVRNAGTGADRTVLTTAAEMSGNTFAWASDGTGIVVAIDNNCQEICAVQGGRPAQELWTVDVVTGASEKVASGSYWLPVVWDRATKRVAAGVTGPGGYLTGYDVIDLSQRPAVVRSNAFPFGTMGRLKASSDARFVMLNTLSNTTVAIAWWPLEAPQKRSDVANFDGMSAEWRPGTSEIWWSKGTELVAMNVLTGATTSLRGSFGQSIAGFRPDGSAAMTMLRVPQESLIVVDVRSGQTARLLAGGPFVRVR